MTDPDNERLNALCAEAAQKLRLATVLGSERPLLEQARRAMLLAENSDGRGWMPCPERRLDCYDQALKAIALADTIIGQLRRPQNGSSDMYWTQVEFVEVEENEEAVSH
jgi:hypothetical protein